MAQRKSKLHPRGDKGDDADLPNTKLNHAKDPLD
jgi:hypothetical protein